MHTDTHTITHALFGVKKKSETIESCDAIVDCRVRITLETGVSQLSYSPTSPATPPHAHVLMALLACVAKFSFLLVVAVVVRKVVCINNLHSYEGSKADEE